MIVTGRGQLGTVCLPHCALVVLSPRQAMRRHRYWCVCLIEPYETANTRPLLGLPQRLYHMDPSLMHVCVLRECCFKCACLCCG